MTPVLPPLVPLPDPPGSVATLLAVVDELATAGFAAGLVGHLVAAAAGATGWHGADAAAAHTEVAATGAVAADLHDAVRTAQLRLQAHAETWLVVERRLGALRRDQEHERAVAGARLSALLGPTAGIGPGPWPPEAGALIAAFTDDEAVRSAQHRALLADLADDARRSVAVLTAAGSRLGGAGRRGDGARVQVHLAAALPGWGAGAMTGLGLTAAQELTATGTTADRVAAALRYAPYAGAPAFATALARGLGRDGVDFLLAVLGSGTGSATVGAAPDEAAALAALLARAFTTVLSGPVAPAGTDVEGSALLDPRDRDGAPDVVALGMGAVLAAPGAGARLAGSWGRAVLEREHQQGASAVQRTSPTRPDPVRAALTVIARDGDGAAAAALLGAPAAWSAALARTWPDDGAMLGSVVGLAAASPAGAGAAQAALQALGTGLAPGSATPAVDDLGTLAAVRGDLGRLVAAHVDGVVVPVLQAVAVAPATAPGPDAAADSALRGLGLLMSRSEPEAAVVDALAAELRGGAEAGPEVAGAFVAVQEYGARIRYALACARAVGNAVDRQLDWTIWVSLPTVFLPGAAEAVVGGLGDLGAERFRADGAVAFPEDTGSVRTAADAALFAERLWPPAPSGAFPATAMAVSARSGFRGMTAVLGVPVVPAAPPGGLIDQFEPPDRRNGRAGRPRRRGRR